MAGAGGTVHLKKIGRIAHGYRINGFISSGTYGRVYKAESRLGIVGEFAIKK